MILCPMLNVDYLYFFILPLLNLRSDHFVKNGHGTNLFAFTRIHSLDRTQRKFIQTFNNVYMNTVSTVGRCCSGISLFCCCLHSKLSEWLANSSVKYEFQFANEKFGEPICIGSHISETVCGRVLKQIHSDLKQSP